MCFGRKNQHHDDQQLAPKPNRKRTQSQQELTGFSCIVTSYASGLGLCKGCSDEVCWLLEDWKLQRSATDKSIKSTTSQSSAGRKAFEQKPRRFHDSFAQLTKCAERCTACRVFYQALLLRQATTADQDALFESSKPLLAVILQCDSNQKASLLPELVFKISVGQSDDFARTAYVSCTRQEKYDFLQLGRGTKDSKQCVQKWLQDCRVNHLCGELDWSTSNPTRLIEIVDDSRIRLVRGSQHSSRLPYMILSYCWGGVDTGITVTENVERRMSAFDVAELPQTLQDAITIARHNEIQHVWIDQLCIQQDDSKDWEREATKMHEYYGNALFTLCAAANQRANENILKDRPAWKWNQLYCDLNGWQIAAFDTTLDQARRESPLSKRGWTLQEEYLSPRVVYWFNHALYWSCAGAQGMENAPDNLRRPKQPDTLGSHRPRQTNVFLTACWNGSDSETLHKEWLDIVESFTRRRLTVASDKFNALSGIAARYFTAGQKRNQYLAGLWRNTLAQELAFAVKVAGETSASAATGSKFAPSWSWASLPPNVHVVFKQDLQEQKVSMILKSVDQQAIEKDSADEHVRHGSNVKTLMISGPVGRLWSPQSKPVSWSSIDQSDLAPGKLSFAQYRHEDAHSADPSSGRLAVYRAHTQEIIAQLDYQSDAQKVEQGQLQLHYLLLTNGTALLLQSDDNQYFRRVGVCYSTRFADEPSLEHREVTLI